MATKSASCYTCFYKDSDYPPCPDCSATTHDRWKPIRENTTGHSCSTCKFEDCSSLKHPCSVCGLNHGQSNQDMWQPKEKEIMKEEKTCMNCRYKGVNSGSLPCKECPRCYSDNSPALKWEPREMTIKQSCKDCLYNDSRDSARCANCVYSGIGKTNNFVSKEQFNLSNQLKEKTTIPEVNITASKVLEVLEKLDVLKYEKAISRFIEAFNNIDWTEGSFCRDAKNDLHVAFAPDAFITKEYKIFVKDVSATHRAVAMLKHFVKNGFQFELEKLDEDEYCLLVYLDRKEKH